MIIKGVGTVIIMWTDQNKCLAHYFYFLNCSCVQSESSLKLLMEPIIVVIKNELLSNFFFIKFMFYKGHETCFLQL